MKLLATLIIGTLIAIGGWLAIGAGFARAPSPSFGSFSPTGGGTYRLKSSVGTTDTTINLSSFKEPVSNIPYTITYLGSSKEYGTLDPQSTRSEFVSFTGITQNSDGSAQLTGVTRGLSRTPAGSSCVASTTLAQSHAGQSIFILSDSPCFFQEYYTLNNNATSSAILTFASTSPPRLDNPAAQSTGTYIATTSEFASIAYVNKIAIAGANNATEGVNGLVQLATGLQAASSTQTGSTGANLALWTKYATDTPQNCTLASPCVPFTDTTGKIAQAFLNLTKTFSWSAIHTFTAGLLTTASSTLNATTTIAASDATNNALVLNTVKYAFPSSQGSANNVLTNNGAGVLSWAAPLPAAQTSIVDEASTSTTQTLAVDAYTTGNITITTGANRVLLCFNGVGSNGTTNDGGAAYFKIDAGSDIQFANFISPTGGQQYSVSGCYLTDSLTAASHTFKLRINAVTGGTFTFNANANGRFSAVEIK